MKVPALLFLFLSSVSISAWAGTEAPGALCAKCPAHTASGWIMTRRDNPDSTVVEDEGAVAPHSPTNDEINAAETGSPDSPEYRDAPESEISGNVNAEWEALEAGNPHLAQPGNRVAAAATTPAEKCDCIVMAIRDLAWFAASGASLDGRSAAASAPAVVPSATAVKIPIGVMPCAAAAVAPAASIIR
jgi:hypothetical protein